MEGKPATGNWVSVKKKFPEEGRSYLVLVDGPYYIPDVAYYNGRNSGGVREWILGDGTRIPEILFWAEINIGELNE